MKIYKETGSKDRLFEMMQRVNRVTLNEDTFGQPQNNGSMGILTEKLRQLTDGTLKVQQSNTQTNGDESYLELKCIDDSGNMIFNFRINASTGDQDGVFNVNSAELVNFKLNNTANGQSIEIDEPELKQFNAEHTNEFIEIASNYADFETQEPNIDEEYMNAIKKIDSYPFGGGSTRMQTGKAYADEKPINPKLRVKSPELDKFVDESPAADYYANNDNNSSSDFYKKLPSDKKSQIIAKAKKIVDDDIISKGLTPNTVERSEYLKNIQQKALELYTNDIAKLNEDSKYPDQIGKKFKPKSDYPNVVKKPKLTVTLDENENPDSNEVNSGMQIEPDFGKMGMSMNNDKSSEENNEDQESQPNSQPIDCDALDMSKGTSNDDELLVGGIGDGKSPDQFDPEQISKGIKVEMEHTDNPRIALEICIDHLSEDEFYYTVKNNPEDSAQFNAAEDANKDDDTEMTDVLLGYEPQNVGDYESNDDEHEESSDEEHEESETSDEEHEEHETPDEENKEDDDDEKKENNLNENWNRLETARMVLKVSDIKAATMGMTKKEAVQILITNNMKKK